MMTNEAEKDRPMHRNTFSACCAAALMFIGTSTTAAAAPQILALLSTDGAVELDCRNGTCAAEFSGFCLQRKRPDPAPGTQYRAAGGDVTLVITGTDGSERRIAADDYVSIETERGYTAVSIAIDRALLGEWNAVAVAVEVGENVALVPVPETVDPDPQTEADIALALGPQRGLGERILNSSPEETGAVRLTNRMIGALPPGRTDEATRDGLWDRVVVPSAPAFPAASVDRASALYQRCLSKVEAGSFYSLRNCLEIGHDALMIDLNVKYWNAGPES